MSTQNKAKPEETIFRQLFEALKKGRGDVPDWPLALLRLLEWEFQQPRKIWYTGESLFMDRDDYDHTEAVSPEKSKTRMLFKRCREKTKGCLKIDDDVFWLVSWEDPNFADRSHQCADLLGLSISGGLVVFECKLKNRDAPVTAAIEGLDYLSCLTAEPNFGRLKSEFEKWRNKGGQIIPPDFKEVDLKPTARHEVIVLATPEYFDDYRLDPCKSKNTRRGDGWENFAAACENQKGPLRIRFAETDFSGTSAKWID